MTGHALWSAGALALAIITVAGGAARAQDDPLFVVVRYHEALRAAELCEHVKLTSVQQDKLAVLVGQATRHTLPVGEELNAIREGRANMEQRVTTNGCKDPLVTDALRFYGTVRDRLR
jgi:hypothetical protein